MWEWLRRTLCMPEVLFPQYLILDSSVLLAEGPYGWANTPRAIPFLSLAYRWTVSPEGNPETHACSKTCFKEVEAQGHRCLGIPDGLTWCSCELSITWNPNFPQIYQCQGDLVAVRSFLDLGKERMGARLSLSMEQVPLIRLMSRYLTSFWLNRTLDLDKSYSLDARKIKQWLCSTGSLEECHPCVECP